VWLTAKPLALQAISTVPAATFPEAPVQAK
jgi:hypothetical protein